MTKKLEKVYINGVEISHNLRKLLRSYGLPYTEDSCIQLIDCKNNKDGIGGKLLEQLCDIVLASNDIGNFAYKSYIICKAYLPKKYRSILKRQ